MVVDQPATIGALAVAVAQHMTIPADYLPGLTMRRIADLYPEDAKTDEKAAFIMADAARSLLPHTLRELTEADIDEATLRMLTGFDLDLSRHINQVSNRIRGLLTQIHPTLEKVLGLRLEHDAILEMLATWPTPEKLRKAGRAAIGTAGDLLGQDLPGATKLVQERTKEAEALLGRVEKAQEEVEESNVAWQAEQDRLAQIAAAGAARAASQSATAPTSAGASGGGQAPAPSGSPGSAAVPSEPATSHYYLSASNCGDAWNAGACVDGYSITYVDFSPWGGPQWVGGHTGGAAGVILNFKPGDLVTVSGSSGAGTYRVIGSTWIPKVGGQQATSLGRGFAFQTCSGNQMRIVYATPAGRTLGAKPCLAGAVFALRS